MIVKALFHPVAQATIIATSLVITIEVWLTLSNTRRAMGISGFTKMMPVEAGKMIEKATSGNLFKGKRVRHYSGPMLFQNERGDADDDESDFKPQAKLAFPQLCEKWSVVTTIFKPSDAVRKQAKLPSDWCLVIVADKKTPASYDVEKGNSTIIYLTIQKQQTFGDSFPLFYSQIPFNSFARKNLGYLYAIAHGAKIIWDFDDDNMLYNVSSIIPPGMKPGSHINALEVASHQGQTFNPYPLMGCPHFPCWPRGFPLTHITNTTSYKYNLSECTNIQWPLSSVGLIQSLANHDPDMDAIYRLTMPLPFDFNKEFKTVVAVPQHAYTPLNAQATLTLEHMLWMLYLPFTVHGRVADIWRAYFAERLARDAELRILFSPPLVVQHRNVHSYLADLDAEQHLYKRAEVLLEKLDALNFKSKALPGRLEELYVDMYTRNIIQIEDVRAVQGWLKALVSIGYNFPSFN